MKHIPIVIAFALCAITIMWKDSEAGPVYEINTLSPSLRTVCLAGDPSIYRFAEQHAAEVPDLSFVKLHDHPATPPQPTQHYYWVNQAQTSCGAMFVWITKDSNQIQAGEAMALALRALDSGKFLAVGVEPDHPNFAQWKNALATRGNEIKTSLANVWLTKDYVLGVFSSRKGLPIVD